MCCNDKSSPDFLKTSLSLNLEETTYNIFKTLWHHRPNIGRNDTEKIEPPRVDIIFYLLQKICRPNNNDNLAFKKVRPPVSRACPLFQILFLVMKGDSINSGYIACCNSNSCFCFCSKCCVIRNKAQRISAGC
jgi:hypothetical protein